MQAASLVDAEALIRSLVFCRDNADDVPTLKAAVTREKADAEALVAASGDSSGAGASYRMDGMAVLATAVVMGAYFV